MCEVRLADGERHRQRAHRTSVGWIDGGTDRQGVRELPFAWEVPVEVDADGFVARRPAYPGTSDDPMWQDYQFVAMLDPVELADGRWRRATAGARRRCTAGCRAARLRSTCTASTRRCGAGGRPGGPRCRPREEYEPRCSCCPLLFGRVSEDLEAMAGGPRMRDRQPGLTYATRYLVALDVVTGICVHVEHLDGDHAGRGFSVDILAVGRRRVDSRREISSMTAKPAVSNTCANPLRSTRIEPRGRGRHDRSSAVQRGVGRRGHVFVQPC